MAEFFDKMVVGLNRGVTSMKESSRIMVEKANLNTSIKENEAKKKQILLQLGTLAYELQLQGIINVEEFNDVFNAAIECDAENAKMKERLKALEPERPAAPTPPPATPTAPISSAETIASEVPVAAHEISAPTPTPSAPVQESVICRNCNGENRVGARFCVRCGTPLV